MKIDQVIIKPILTEKATNHLKNQAYTFLVNRRAVKEQIRVAIEKIYSVTVAKVSIINRKGKLRRTGRRMTNKKLPDQKIAIVKLKQGKIDIFPSA